MLWSFDLFSLTGDKRKTIEVRVVKKGNVILKVLTFR